MEEITIWSYRLVLTWKEEWDARSPNHLAHSYTTLRQCHTTKLVYVCATSGYGQHHQTVWDWLFAMHDQLKLGVVAADCVMLALIHERVSGVIHLSRRNFANWILQKSINFLCRQSISLVDTTVYMSPSIQQRSYQVGEEFLEIFDERFFVRRESDLYFDLPWAIYQQLVDAWADQQSILRDHRCTFEDEMFFSYRGGDRDLRNFLGIEKISR